MMESFNPVGSCQYKLFEGKFHSLVCQGQEVVCEFVPVALIVLLASSNLECT